MGTVPDRDIKALPGTETFVTLAAADARAIRAAGGGHSGVCTGDGNVIASSAAVLVGECIGVGLAAADARAAFAADGSDGAAGDGDVVGVAAADLERAADARAARAAGGGQAAGLTTPPPVVSSVVLS